jgi:hypothetical protein
MPRDHLERIPWEEVAAFRHSLPGLFKLTHYRAAACHTLTPDKMR